MSRLRVSGEILIAMISFTSPRDGTHARARRALYVSCVSRPRLLGGLRGFFPPSLDVELEEQHVPVLDDVFLAFHAVEPLLARDGDRTALDQVLVRDRFRLDEPARESGVDDARGFRGRVALMDGPRADFLLAGGEVGLQPEQVIGRAN